VKALLKKWFAWGLLVTLAAFLIFSLFLIEEGIRWGFFIRPRLESGAKALDVSSGDAKPCMDAFLESVLRDGDAADDYMGAICALRRSPADTEHLGKLAVEHERLIASGGRPAPETAALSQSEIAVIEQILSGAEQKRCLLQPFFASSVASPLSLEFCRTAERLQHVILLRALAEQRAGLTIEADVLRVKALSFGYHVFQQNYSLIAIVTGCEMMAEAATALQTTSRARNDQASAKRYEILAADMTDVGESLAAKIECAQGNVLACRKVFEGVDEPALRAFAIFRCALFSEQWRDNNIFETMYAERTIELALEDEKFRETALLISRDARQCAAPKSFPRPSRTAAW
jgi:hypothetical protein